MNGVGRFLACLAGLSMMTGALDGQPLLNAADRDDLDAVRELVEAGAGVDEANRHGVTALSLACRNGSESMIRLLLEKGADPNGKLSGGETVLMTAARTGRPGGVRALLEKGAQVDAREGRGQTALMWAAAEGHLEVVELLIEQGADIRVRLASGFDALLFAVREGHGDVVKVLIEAGAEVSQAAYPKKPNGRSMRPGTAPLILALENGHFELALVLVDAGADPNDQRSGYAPLHALTWVRKSVRGDGVDGMPPPVTTGAVTSLEFARELVKRGAKVNLRLKKGSGFAEKMNPKAATPFFMAAETCDLDLLKLLVELGADPSIPNADQTSPLLIACGIGVNAPGEEAGTEEDALEVVPYLLELGADINAVDKKGETVMHGAAYKAAP
ncbi:MAG: ankyrin repeat domain-containing protein, partial [Verrucomicrobiota bacterium]